jgi:hypothetical protein
MSYKDLLLVLDAEPTARERTDLAAALAERFSAHLVGLYPLPTPQMPRHFGYYDPALIDPLFVELRERARSAAVKVREAFDHATGLRGLSGGAKSRRVPTPIRRCTPAMPIWRSSASSIPIAPKRS